MYAKIIKDVAVVNTFNALRAKGFSNTEIAAITKCQTTDVESVIGLQPRKNYKHMGQYQNVNIHLTRKQMKDIRQGVDSLNMAQRRRICSAFKRAHPGMDIHEVDSIIQKYVKVSDENMKKIHRAYAYKTA